MCARTQISVLKTKAKTGPTCVNACDCVCVYWSFLLVLMDSSARPMTHSIPVRALWIKIAAQLGHNVQKLALIRTLCVCGFQKQAPLPAHMTGEVKGRIGGREDKERGNRRGVWD